MIKLTDGKDVISQFDEDDIFFRKIMSEHSFSGNYSDTYLYFQSAEDKITSLIFKSGNAITMCFNDGANYDEINEFLGIIGYDSIFCDEIFFAKLKLHKTRSGKIMLCEYKEKRSEHNCDVINIDNENLKDLYELIDSCFELKIDFSSWFVDCSHKLRHNFLNVKAVSVSEKYVSCAFSMFEYKNSVIINSVCTDVLHRGKGYATACINSLQKELYRKGIFYFYVFCEDGEIGDFYKKSGFKNIGRWCEYVRKI